MKTTKAILIKLQATLRDNYAKELEKLPMKKTTREILVDGFNDGARQGINHVVQMLEVEVSDE